MNVGGCLVLLAAVVLAFGFTGARKPLDDYRLLLVFENGEQRIFDVKPYLQRGVFTRL